MWKSTKTVSRDIRNMQNEMTSLLEEHQKQCLSLLREILLKMEEIQTSTNGNIGNMLEAVAGIRSEIGVVDQKISEIRKETKSGLKACKDKISGTDHRIEEFADAVMQDLSMLDEGTRLLIANMLLGEMGD